MTNVLDYAAGIFILVVAGVALWKFTSTWLRYRGKRVVTCPETKKAAAVEVNAVDAAKWATIGGLPDVHLSECTRWPERQDCDQACLKQIESSPEDCLARTMLARWYEGKKCAFCQKTFEQVNWADHRPALLDPKGITLEWSEVAAERLPEVFQTHRPVCWNCHITETFRREHSDLVTERERELTAIH